jgi:hypothetical protein
MLDRRPSSRILEGQTLSHLTGIPAAVCMGRAMRSILLASPHPPRTQAAAAAFVLALGFTAGAIPARRAPNVDVDPAMTLRVE